MSHPTNLATLNRPERKTIQAHVENIRAETIGKEGKMELTRKVKFIELTSF
jgi:hypothetical protein